MAVPWGAQQTYDWVVRFPGAVKRAAPIAGLAKGTPHNRLLVETFIEAITSDPAGRRLVLSRKRGASGFAPAWKAVRGGQALRRASSMRLDGETLVSRPLPIS